jgi:hypothetical protein
MLSMGHLLSSPLNSRDAPRAVRGDINDKLKGSCVVSSPVTSTKPGSALSHVLPKHLLDHKSFDHKSLPNGYSGGIWTDQIDAVSSVGFTH